MRDYRLTVSRDRLAEFRRVNMKTGDMQVQFMYELTLFYFFRIQKLFQMQLSSNYFQAELLL